MSYAVPYPLLPKIIRNITIMVNYGVYSVVPKEPLPVKKLLS